MEFTQEQKNEYLDKIALSTQQDIWMSEMVIFRNELKKEGVTDKTQLKHLDKKIADSQKNIERMKADLELIEKYRNQLK